MTTARVLRDIEDGVLLLDTTGTIVEMNLGAQQLMGLSENFLGRKYTELMALDSSPDNDAFHQMIVDCLTDNRRVHRKRLNYLRPDGVKKTFDVSSSVMWSEDGSKKEGLFLSFSDETEEEQLRSKVTSSAQIFIVLLGVICLWDFIYALWNFIGQPITTAVMSKLLILIALIPALFTWRSLHLSYAEVGLEYRGKRRVIVTDCLITLGGFAAMAVVKCILLRVSPDFFPAGTPFFNVRKYQVSEYLYYAVSVVAQEFISRGIVHECMRRVIPGKNSEAMAIIVSAFMFGALHIHVGLVYMLGATALLGVLGLVYRRQGTIWGLCIPHYVLGMVLGLMDFVAY